MLIKTITFAYILLVSSSLSVFCQSERMITGTIQDIQTGEPIEGSNITIGQSKTTSRADGTFVFNAAPSGELVITVSSLGYEIFKDTLTKLPGENLKLTISLQSNSNSMEAVEIATSADRQKVRRAPIRTVLVDTKATSTRATSLTDLMNHGTGIRVRQAGGVGNRPEISINGFQGKAIKYFKDGIPIDHLGEAYNLSSFPVELLDRIEIYKGVLPTSLGTDALGGAVNLVPLDNYGQSLRMYYEIGSFGTHRLGAMIFGESKDQIWKFGLETSYSHAENDYDALIEVVDPDTRNLSKQRRPMFHNAYDHLFAETFIGLQNLPWAQELKLSVVGFHTKREQQHPALLTNAYGALFSKQHTIAPSLRYKLHLFDGRLKIDQYSSFIPLNMQRVDTLRGAYDWLGNFTPRTTVGESRLASLSEVDEDQIVARTNLNFNLSASSKLELNHVYTSVRRKGLDPYGPRLAGTEVDVLSLPSRYEKQILALGWEKFANQEKFHNQLIAKFYFYSASGIQNTWFSADVTENNKRETSGKYWGITEAFKYSPSPTSMARMSAEYTYRLADREELFGNQIFIVPNFELAPEQSLNINLSYQRIFFQRLTWDLNAFYRNTRNLILLVPIQAPNAQYQNQEKIRGYGVDMDLSYRFTRALQINANATWQDLRLYGLTHPQEVWKNGARLRNTPYFFANFSAQQQFASVISHSDPLKVYVNYHYMREFYLETIPRDLEPGGLLGLRGSANLNSTLIIPDQHLLSGGFTYQTPYPLVTIGGEVRNILDQDVYDYYRIPRPGQSFHLKVTYKLAK